MAAFQRRHRTASIIMAFALFQSGAGLARAEPPPLPAPTAVAAQRVLIIGGRVSSSAGPVEDALVSVNAGGQMRLSDALALARTDENGSYVVFVSVSPGTDLVVSAMRNSDEDGRRQRTFSNPASRAAGDALPIQVDFDLETDPFTSSGDPTPTPSLSPTASPQPTGTPAPRYATEPPAVVSTPGSVPVAILFNDRHVYVKPVRIVSGRVVAPLVRGNTILVPLREMFEQLGAQEVSFDPASKTVRVAKPGSVVTVTVGRPVIVVNGEARPLDVPPEMDNGVVLVPVRVLAEAMGAYVEWVPQRHIVVVRFIATAPPTPPPPSPTPLAVPTPRPTTTPVAFPTPTPSATPRIVTVAYATNRNRLTPDLSAKRNFGEQLGGAEPIYGTVEVQFPAKLRIRVTDTGNVLYDGLAQPFFGDAWKEVTIARVYAQGEDAVLRDLESGRGHRAKKMLLFIHGFNVDFNTGVKAAGILKVVGEYGDKVMLFSWPAPRVTNPLTALRVYEDNGRFAEQSVHALETVLTRLGQRNLDIQLVAHSMGNRVLLAALQNIESTGDPTVRKRYHNAYAALVAADVERQKACEAFAALSGNAHFANVVSERDGALSASYLHSKRHRLGEGGVNTLLLPTAAGFTLDASSSMSNPPFHGYLWDNELLAKEVIGLRDGTRGVSKDAVTDRMGYYVFKGSRTAPLYPKDVADPNRCTAPTF